MTRALVGTGLVALLVSCGGNGSSPMRSEPIPDDNGGGSGGGPSGGGGSLGGGSAGRTGEGGTGVGGSGPGPSTPVDASASGGVGGSPARDGGSARDVSLPADIGPPANAVECKVAKFCDDFESYTVGTRPTGWSINVSKNATLLVDGSKAWSGTRSIAIKTPGATATALIGKGKPLLPLAGNLLYGRMMVFLTASPMGGVHWNSIIGSGPTPAGTRASYSYGAMYQKLLANYNPHDCYKGSRSLWPTGRWACFQWQYDGSKNPDGTQKNEMHLWIDGAGIADETVVRFGAGCVDNTKSEWVAPSFDSLQVGWANYQSSPIPIEMWIDDVAFDGKPVSCPNK